MYLHRDYFKANVFVIWVHGPSNPKPLILRAPTKVLIILNHKGMYPITRKKEGVSFS